MKKRIAIFASGSGSNAEKICAHFKNHPTMEVALIVSNKPTAGVLAHAKHYQIPSLVFNRRFFYNTQGILAVLNDFDIDLVALAGFLWLIPEYLVEGFSGPMLNIHPALLPKYGGKGMYGMNVHRAVKENREIESGITIHFVDQNFDEGEVVFQSKCSIDPDKDSPAEIAKKVLSLEHKHFAQVIEEVLQR